MRTRNAGQSSRGKTDRYANHPTLAPQHNYFSNGNFLIDQVNEGAAYTVNTNSVACMDGIRANLYGTGVFTVERATHPDNAAIKACKISCTTADTSIAASDIANIILPIPGNECSDLKSGTTEAKSITIQFMFKTNVIGIYGVSVCNSAGDRFYANTIEATATTTQKHTIIIPLDVTGTWLYTSDIGLKIRFALMAGSASQGTLNTWGSSNVSSSTAQCNFLSSTSNVCYISELQVVEGMVAGKMPVADYWADLARCQRRFEKSVPQGTLPSAAWTIDTAAGVEQAHPAAINIMTTPFKVSKASVPAITIYDRTGAVNKFTYYITGWNDGGDYTTKIATENQFFLQYAMAGTIMTAFTWTADCRL